MPPPAVIGGPVLDADRLQSELAAVRGVSAHLERVERWLEDGIELATAGSAIAVGDEVRAPAELPPPAEPAPAEPTPASGPRPDDDVARPAPRPTPPAAVAPAGTGGEPVDQAAGPGEPPTPDTAATDPRVGVTRHSAARSADTLERIRGAFARLGDGWLTTRSVAGEAGLDPGTVSGRLKELVAAGEIEHNGKGGAGKRHRIVPDGPAEQEAPRTASAGVSRRVSRRVAREVERERLAAATAVGRQNGADPREGTLEGRIMQALIGGSACGIRELAKRVGMTVPTEQLVSTVSVLASHGDVRVYPNPRRTEIGQETKLIEARA